MVKFTATNNGRILIGLGLEAENIRRMQTGKPVYVRLRDLGFTGATGRVEIVIFTGDTAETMRRDLADFIGPETVIIEEPPPAPNAVGEAPELTRG